MQIRKKWLNQLKNFLTNIFENFIWHLFAGESHQVVKITVPYPTPYPQQSYRLEREGHWKGWALKLMYIKLTTYTSEYRTQNTEYRNSCTVNKTLIDTVLNIMQGRINHRSINS